VIAFDTTTPAVERELALDMVKRGLPFAPVLIGVAAAVAGAAGAASAAYAIAIVFANLLVSAALLGWAARRGPTVLMAVALGGFIVRMGLLTAAVFVVKDASWVSLPALGVSVLVASLGLLFWETRYVSASLAFPGLKPTGKGA
jgi:hypothetical protein